MTYRGVFIDVYNTGRAYVTEIQEGPEAIARLLNVDLIDYQSVTISGKSFDCWVDDDGLYSHGKTPAFSVMHDGKPVLCGPAFIINGDPETGESFSLTDDEITLILGNVRPQVIKYKTGKTYNIEILIV